MVVNGLQVRTRKNFLAVNVSWIRTAPGVYKTAITAVGYLKEPSVYLTENLFWTQVLIFKSACQNIPRFVVRNLGLSKDNVQLTANR
jgi:hypothetical protein